MGSGLLHSADKAGYACDLLQCTATRLAKKIPNGQSQLEYFVNREVVAWIKARDGGIGPQASCEIQTRYVYQK